MKEIRETELQLFADQLHRVTERINWNGIVSIE